MPSFQPQTQVQLTNVAVVRFTFKKKKKKLRFEIACYKNKVMNFREGVETAMDEVLQIDTIFTNVQRGIAANNADLLTAFGTTDLMEICHMILAKGDLQISSGERKVQMETMFREVATIISEKCVDPSSDRPYTLNVVERAMKQAHIAVDPSQSAKKQALESIAKLGEFLPIRRAWMAVRVTVPAASSAGCLAGLAALGEQCRVISRDEGGVIASLGEIGAHRITCHIDPGKFRYVDTLVQRLNEGTHSLEIIDQCVHSKAGDGGEAGFLDAASASRASSSASAASASAASSAAAVGTASAASSTSTLPPTPPAGSKSCRTCGGAFNAIKYREHFRSEWHRVNLQRKLADPPLPALSETDAAAAVLAAAAPAKKGKKKKGKRRQQC